MASTPDETGPALEARPVLETLRLSLRRLTLDDAPFIVRLLNEPSFVRNIGDRGVRTVEQASSYLENGPLESYERNGFGLYLVELREDGAPIGICGLLKREELDDVDLGFSLMPEYWGCGYAFEAASAVKQYAREVLGVARLAAITAPHNAPSARLLEKLGFTFERMITMRTGGEHLKLFVAG